MGDRTAGAASARGWAGATAGAIRPASGPVPISSAAGSCSGFVIAGGALRGTMYGVYGLLEDHMGCRWFAPGVSRIPKQSRLVLGPIDERQVPVLEYREPFVADCLDGDWCARNRMNSSAGRLETKHGGKVKIWNIAHSWQWLMPADKYFDAHPEYYSLVGGKRQKEHPQL